MGILNQLTIGQRLAIAFGLLLLVMSSMVLNSIRELNHISDSMKAISRTDDQRARMSQVTQARDAFQAAHAAAGHTEPAELRDLQERFVASVNDLVTTQEAALERHLSDSEHAYSRARKTLVILALLALLVGGALATLIVRSITTPMVLALNRARRIAEGDLATASVASGRDEASQLLRALQDTTSRLGQILSNVHASSAALSAASVEVRATAQDLRHSAAQQAASVEMTSAAIERISAAVNQNAEAARLTSDAAEQAVREAQAGSTAVNETVSAMQQIAERIGIIDEIANQTDILALNAALEALRAGQHGTGFAVVAAEVRRLAERSQVAAQEIGKLTRSSMALAQKTGTVFQSMAPSIHRTAALVQAIASGSAEQSTAVEQISLVVSGSSRLAQESATSSEELVTTAAELSRHAEQLQQLIAFFKSK